MTKTCNATLLAGLLAVMQTVCAQTSLDAVFAQLDAAESVDAPVQDAEKSSVAEDTGKPLPNTNEAMLSWLFEKGVEHYKAGRHGEAMAMFDGMLAIDKYNADAMAYRTRAAQKMAAAEAKKQGASRIHAMADVAAAWSPQPKALGFADVSEGIAEGESDHQAIERVKDRLEAITIARLDFSDAPIEEVIRFFAETSRSQGGADIDILLVGMESATGDSNVTLSVADMSLYKALQYVVEMASLKFEIKSNLVVVMPANHVPASALVARSYDIIPEIGVNLESFSGDSGGGMDDLFGGTSEEAATGPIDVAGFFSIVGFPEGASAIYQSRYQKLFVKNTPANIKSVEAVLADLTDEALNRRSQQVEIEAKFVEFSEGALEELGFDWNVYGSGTAVGMELDPRDVAPGTDPNTRQDILANGNAGDGRPGQNVFGSAQRSNTTGFESVQSGLLALMGGTPATMVFGNGDIDMKISALEQEGTADVLAAPRVTTRSGTEAVIRVAETHRYPQDYDVETGQRTAPVVKPQDWEDFDLGVSLKVIPVVDIDTATIDLELHPQILKFKGYDEYKVGFNAFDNGGLDVLISGDQPVLAVGGDGSDLTSRMARFERRSVQTQVTIADGHTVVMGGLVDERTETFRDQVPILGDIPYLGRLFRTEGSRSAKKNLTIFVKATLVDPYGMTNAERKLAHQ